MKKFTHTCAFGILTLMAIFMVGSIWNDSAIMDELPHIPAGYSYLTERDYRLNPEHPPLIKAVAAIPLLFQTIHFPDTVKSWTDDINGQWDFGRVFLYESENNADQIIFWSRIPIIILALITGWMLFAWVRGRYGDRAGIITLALFALSPTVIAHSRFVTTDLGATLGFLLGIITFVRFLENPTKKNMLIAGIGLGVAQLLKFSLVLLGPIYVIIAVVWLLAGHIQNKKLFIAKFFGMLAIAALTLYPLYQYTVWNYPPERQNYDTEFLLSSFVDEPMTIRDVCGSVKNILRCPAELTIWASDKPVIRAYAQYALGVLMVFQRSAGGNTAYFLGDVSAQGSRLYFPLAFLMKEAIPTLIFLGGALLLAISRMKNIRYYSWNSFSAWLREHTPEFAALMVILVYWASSIKSPLNIGVRHVMPTFPFIYMLAAIQIDRWLEPKRFSLDASPLGLITQMGRRFFTQYLKYFAVLLLFIWLFLEAAFAFPAYLSYYNEFAGGTSNGYMHIVDSNYDWGQDLIRLKKFVEEKNIEKISLDYFGGGNPAYYLGEKFQPWQSSKGPASGWFAISSSFLMSSQGNPIDGFVIKPEDSYSWLRGKEPVARAGQSIFIYQLP